jgi:hypothetical protein
MLPIKHSPKADANGKDMNDRYTPERVNAFSDGVFAVMVISFWWPLVGFIITCGCLLLYLRPDASRA